MVYGFCFGASVSNEKTPRVCRANFSRRVIRENFDGTIRTVNLVSHLYKSRIPEDLSDIFLDGLNDSCRIRTQKSNNTLYIAA